MDSFVPKSSFIEKAEYSKSDNSMTITFKDGSQFQYSSVFPSTWLSFKQSTNHSVYYARAIKGRLPSEAVITKNIGRKESTPLKQNQLRRPKLNGKSILNAGINRTAGTVPKSL